ncbi:MAG: hypothetical protein K9L28_02140 [Synergistales bacterium]|nr:hypothetical protein [Synergistales bacterium]
MTRKRRRVDWEEEERRTEETRIRGLKFTLGAFVIALGFLLATKSLHRGWPVGSAVTVLAALAGGTLLLILMARGKK